MLHFIVYSVTHQNFYLVFCEYLCIVLLLCKKKKTEVLPNKYILKVLIMQQYASRDYNIFYLYAEYTYFCSIVE